MSMRTTIEQMVRHVSHFEQSELADTIGAGLASDEHVTARLLFINLLSWIRARGIHGLQTTLRLPAFPWATKLKNLVQTCPEFTEAFELKDDKVDFNSARPAEDVRWVESYVVENYEPVAMR
jgi:hypothetical protein